MEEENGREKLKASVRERRKHGQGASVQQRIPSRKPLF